MDNYLTLKEIVKTYGFSKAYLYSLTFSKRLPFLKKDGIVYVKKKDWEACMLAYKPIRKVTKEEKDLWYENFLVGKSILDIGQEFKRDVGAISRHLRSIEGINTKEYHKRRSPEEKQLFLEMRNMYLTEENLSLKEVLRLFNVKSKNAFINYLIGRGDNIKSLSDVRSFVTDYTFFETIDTEIKAYLLGFFAADGHIEKNSNAIKISVHIDDTHILELYNKYICSNKCTLRCIPNTNMVALCFKHPTIHKDISKLGFDHNKTKTWKKLPSIPQDMYPHFIRGFFDGDGSAMFNRRKAHNRLSGYNRKFAISCYNKEILEEIMSHIGIENYTITFKERENFKIQNSFVEKSCNYLLEVSDRKGLKSIYDYLYTNATFYFRRKQNKFWLSVLDDDKISDALQGNL